MYPNRRNIAHHVHGGIRCSVTERTVPVEGFGITIAVFEIAFIVLCGLIIRRDGRTKELNKKQV